MPDLSPSELLAYRIVEALQHASHIAYYAGGCVRDRLLNRTPADFDVATSARPEQVTALFPRAQKVGASFGVILVQDRRAKVEVATFRTDLDYQDGRHPTGVVFATPQADAQRRDFTCNGLFYDPLNRQLHDFVGGQADLAARMLRAIGDPAHRFAEDHLRMLRACRFAAKLGFAIEPVTWQAINTYAAHIREISRERIGEEMRMMLALPTRLTAIELLAASGLLEEIWPPELFASADIWPRVSRLPRQVPAPLPRHVGLLAMQRDMNAQLSDWPRAISLLREAFVLSNHETVAMSELTEGLAKLSNWQNLTAAPLKRLLASPQWENLYTLWTSETRAADELAALDERLRVLRQTPIAPPPLVSGQDLISLGARPGPAFKGWLDQLYDQQLEGALPDRNAALAAAQKLIDSLDPA